MIRVLHILGGLNLGGAETMVMNLYRAIDRTKVQFDFVIHVNEKQAYEDEISFLGGKIYRFPQFNGKNLISVIRLWNNFFLEHSEYQILHSHIRSYASIYIPIAKKYGLKTIIHSHSTSNGKGMSAVVKQILQIPLRYQADYLFACSQSAGKWLYGKNVHKRKNYHLIFNAIDSERFNFNAIKREQVRKELKIDDKFVIGHVGRMSQPKNHIFLIDIFEALLKKRKDVVLLLVGDGELKSKIENIVHIKNLNEKVIFLGSRNNTEDYYNAMDIFVFPSLWEGLGIVAIEAQTSGLPCIVSERIPKEIDLDVNLVHRIDLSSGYETWIDMIENIDVSKRKGQSLATKKAGYDIADNTKYLQNFYLNLVKEKE